MRCHTFTLVDIRHALCVLAGVAALALVLFCLFRPTLVVRAAVAQQNVIAVLLDDSRSMQIADWNGQPRGGFFATLLTNASITDLWGSLVKTMCFGAIIAIERQIGLRNYIEGGIPLDAMVTYDLMASIFQPGSPLHDGAAIIQGDRVAAAACFLPLSVNPRVSRDLGTRHRAALGLTEENDAVAIVVSEETGNISLVIAGDIERGLSADALRVRLRSLLGARRRDRAARAETRSSLA